MVCILCVEPHSVCEADHDILFRMTEHLGQRGGRGISEKNVINYEYRRPTTDQGAEMAEIPVGFNEGTRTNVSCLRLRVSLAAMKYDSYSLSKP